MSKGTRDALILSFLGLILYGLLYYNFYLKDSIIQFQDIQSKIDVAEQKKAALDEDLKNLPNLQRNLDIKNVQNERLEEYLMSEANLSDNIDYIDKLAKLFNNAFSQIRVGIPLQATSKATSTKYYEFAIDVQASMAYQDAMNLVDYIEGGSRKVKISQFDLAPSGGSATQSQPNQAQTNPSQNMYAIKMQINLYSLNLANIDKVYEYSRKRFNNYSEGDGLIFVPDSSLISSTSGISYSNSGSDGTIKQVASQGYDLEIRLGSFLTAGPNFIVNGDGNKYPIRIKSKDRTSVKITFDDVGYSVNVVDVVGKSYDLRGRSKHDTIKMYVGANFPLDVNENQRVGADIQIINNSAKRVDLSFKDSVNRLKLTDRNGNIIYGKSEIEKVYII